ncbi:hypothetical protein MRX96_029144 [Rhipicephalus microplus]
MRSGAPSESIHEPIEKTGPLVSPQASKSLSASDSTKLSLIKAAPTVDKAEQAVVGVKSAATSPFTGGKVMKSATTSPFSQWGNSTYVGRHLSTRGGECVVATHWSGSLRARKDFHCKSP